jgi:hypothetical protein
MALAAGQTTALERNCGAVAGEASRSNRSRILWLGLGGGDASEWRCRDVSIDSSMFASLALRAAATSALQRR